MAPAQQGMFVVAWSQVRVDEAEVSPSRETIYPGALWTWTGRAERLEQGRKLVDEGLRRRVVAKLSRFHGALAPHLPEVPEERPEAQAGIVITDGTREFVGQIIAGERDLLLVFEGALPAADCDHWIVAATFGAAPKVQQAAEVICFTPGTMIATPAGPVPVESLREGMLISTADNGPQRLLWVGGRRISGARLLVTPQLRPVLIRPGAIGLGRPDAALLVSPDHRMLLRGLAAESLFGTPEVLVRAKDLVNDESVVIRDRPQDLTYIHLLFDRHQILFANGIESESFHPAAADLTALSSQDQQALRDRVPELARYGAYARRLLTASEAAILQFDTNFGRLTSHRPA